MWAKSNSNDVKRGKKTTYFSNELTITKWYAGGDVRLKHTLSASLLCGLMRKQDTQQSIIKSVSEQFGPCPRAKGLAGLNSSAFKSLMTLCTSWNVTLLDSAMFMYVDALHNFTQAMAADSVSCFDEAWDPKPFFMPSTKCFFFKWRGEHGAPASAFTISSSTFCAQNERKNIHVYFLVQCKYHWRTKSQRSPDSVQAIKSEMAKRPLGSSYSPNMNRECRKMFHSICDE